MKKFLHNLALLGLVFAFLNIQAPVAFGALDQGTVCTLLNNQQATSNAATPADAANKMFVVTEERLGKADNNISFDCYRKITCTVTKNAAPASTGTGGSQQTQGQGATPSGPPQPNLVRKCTPNYVAADCSGSSDELSTDPTKSADQMKMEENKSYSICEPIRVYVAAAGNQLLYYYIGQIYSYVATLGGMIAVLILIVAGLMRTTAGDNTNQIGEANNMIKKCIYGLALLFLSAIILYTINPNFFVLQ